MNRILYLITTVIVSICLYSCGQNIDVEDKEAPSKPVFKEKNNDTAFVESGIDAISEADHIYLEWKQNKEADLQGYIVESKHQDSTEWKQLGTILTKNDTTFIDNSPGLVDDNNTNKFYFYRITAVDESGNRSEPSFEQHYRLLQKVIVNSFRKQGNDTLVVDCSYPGDDFNSIFFIFKFYGDNNQIIYSYQHPAMIQENHNIFYLKKADCNFDYTIANLAIRVDAKLNLWKGSESVITPLQQK